jgi:hypothetical protein
VELFKSYRVKTNPNFDRFPGVFLVNVQVILLQKGQERLRLEVDEVVGVNEGQKVALYASAMCELLHVLVVEMERAS